MRRGRNRLLRRLPILLLAILFFSRFVFSFPSFNHQPQQPTRQILTLLPPDSHRLTNQPRLPARSVAPPELLLQHRILEIVVRTELEADQDRARVDGGLEVGYAEVCEGGEEEEGVGGLDVLVNIHGGFLED